VFAVTDNTAHNSFDTLHIARHSHHWAERCLLHRRKDEIIQLSGCVRISTPISCRTRGPTCTNSSWSGLGVSYYPKERTRQCERGHARRYGAFRYRRQRRRGRSGERPWHGARHSVTRFDARRSVPQHVADCLAGKSVGWGTLCDVVDAQSHSGVA